MENLDETVCRLCLANINSKNSKAIDEHPKDMISILLPKLNLEGDNHLMCNDCSVKLIAAFDFKVTCINTEDSIFPYVNAEVGLVDLREVYVKEHVNEPTENFSKDHQVCRLCMQITSDFVHPEQVETDIFKKFIPEVNLSCIKNPVICKMCFDSLYIHNRFLRICVDTDEKIKQAAEIVSKIKIEEVEIKPEENYTDEEYAIDPDDIEQSEMTEFSKSYTEVVPDADGVYQCNICEFNTKIKQLFIDHQSKHGISPKLQTYKCKVCKYQTSRYNRLQVHKKKHKLPIEKKPLVYKCDMCYFATSKEIWLDKHKQNHLTAGTLKCKLCTYETGDQDAMRSHKTKHVSPKPGWHKCDTCDFQNKLMCKVRCHQLRHLDPTQVKMHKCDYCNFQSHDRIHVRIHQVKHVRSFYCDQCDYQSKTKYDLKNHTNRYHLSTPITFKCNSCDFQAKSRGSLDWHKDSHKDLSQVTMHKCDICGYQSMYKRFLNRHLERHMDPSKLVFFKCANCDFQTRFKLSLEKHQLRHRDPSQVPKYKCDKCPYETKNRFSLRDHLSDHEDILHKRVYECDECKFSTNRAVSFKKHKSKHRRMAKAQVQLKQEKQ